MLIVRFRLGMDRDFNHANALPIGVGPEL
jgi:hypothetical protein